MLPPNVRRHKHRAVASSNAVLVGVPVGAFTKYARSGQTPTNDGPMEGAKIGVCRFALQPLTEREQ